MPESRDCTEGIVRYRCHGGIVETTWKDANPAALIDALPWRRFPCFLGQRNYSGLYWASTERTLVGYESRLELSRLTMLDFDRRVKRIASQPFCLVAAVDGKRLKRTIDYLALTDEGPRAIDVKRRDELERIDVHDVLEQTRRVVEARGWIYEVVCEPDETHYANIKFLAGYRRDWLFQKDVLAEVRETVAKNPGQPIRAILELATSPKHVAKAGLLHLLWTQELRADISVRLSVNSTVEVAQ
jgi:hypothetical protein